MKSSPHEDISSIHSSFNNHQVTVSTNNAPRPFQMGPKPSGYGSAVNGGELFMLALAACFCNDLYREAARRNIQVDSVDVEVTGTFGAEGEAGRDFYYHASVKADAAPEAIDDLIRHTDQVAEIHNTLRAGAAVSLVHP